MHQEEPWAEAKRLVSVQLSNPLKLIPGVSAPQGDGTDPRGHAVTIVVAICLFSHQTRKWG